MIAINGRYIVRKQTGQERFAQELIRELDKIAKPGEFVVVTPEYATELPQYTNIPVVKYGTVKSHFWEQVDFYNYVRKHKLQSLNLTTTCPLLSPGIVCLHDASIYEIRKMLTRNLYGKLSMVWHRLIFKAAARKADKIITVSNYSKKKLEEILHIEPERIHVVHNAWQHFERVEADASVFDRLPKEIRRKEYFMALSSLTPQKNFVWIREVAKRNPNSQFVIVGRAEGFTDMGADELGHNNVHFTGYLTDGEIKALMEGCRAFIHPAIYEGFGIPPIEALASGAELILSDATCLPEIYGKSAHYIDPYNYDVDLEALLKEPVEPAEKVLERFNWAREANKLYNIVKER